MTKAFEFPQVPPPPGGVAAYPRMAGRLHPAVMAIWPLGQVGPVLLLLVAGALLPTVALVLVLASATVSVVRYLRFSWRLEPDALVIEQGLLHRQRRVIPLERVQSVDLARKLRHRMFGVVEVRVEAVGGGETEGRLDALSVADGRRFRALLLGERNDEEPSDLPAVAAAEEGGEPLVRLTPGQLVVAGLTGGRVGVAAALLGFGQELFADRIDELLRRAPAVLGTRGIVAVVVVALLGAFVLSIVVTVLRYWNFTLTREGPRLRIRRGLLEQRSDTLPLRRVQALRVEENVLRRWLGLAAVKVDVAGRAGNEGRDTGTLVPLAPRADAFALAGRVLDAPELAATDLQPMPARARTRRVVRALLASGAVTAVAVALLGPAGWLATLLALPALALAEASYRALGHAATDAFVIARAGVLVRRTAFVPKARLQSLALTATPFQRLRRLATLDLQIARSPGVWGGPQLVDLDGSAGRALLADLAATVGSGAVVGGGFEPP